MRELIYQAADPKAAEGSMITADPEEARVADAELDQLLSVVREPVTRLAILIHRIRDQELYRPLGHKTFEAYVGSKKLHFSRSFVFQLAKVGKMLAASGVDPLKLPGQNVEITKLVQIARLPDASDQRQILETGVYGVANALRSLADIPVRELTGMIDLRLGKEPRGRSIRTLSEAYDQAPWDPNPRFDPATKSRKIVAHRGIREIRLEPSGGEVGWRLLVADLGNAIRPLSGPERDEAINAVSRLYQEMVRFD